MYGGGLRYYYYKRRNGRGRGQAAQVVEFVKSKRMGVVLMGWDGAEAIREECSCYLSEMQMVIESLDAKD